MRLVARAGILVAVGLSLGRASPAAAFPFPPPYCPCTAPRVCVSGVPAPSMNICLLPCTSHEDCLTDGTDALCSPIPLLDDQRVCVPSCPTSGEGAGGCSVGGFIVLEEFACVPLEGPLPPTLPTGHGGACMPRCSDSRCGPSSMFMATCNEALGLCVNTPTTGDEDYTVGCVPESSSTLTGGGCKGACVAGERITEDGVATVPVPRCLRACARGRHQTCGWPGTGPAEDVCVIVPDEAVDMGTGALGYCAPTCNCQADCAFGICATLDPASAVLATRRGVCVEPGTRLLDGPAPDVGIECLSVEAGLDVGACVYGPTKPCRGPGDCLGASQCLPDQSGYSACTCRPALSADSGPDANAASDAASMVPRDGAADAPIDGAPNAGGGADARAEGGAGGQGSEAGGGGCDCSVGAAQRMRGSGAVGGGLLALALAWRRRRSRERNE